MNLKGCLFEFVGWLVCVFTMQMDKFAYLVAQARHESGEYTSKSFREDRSAFGMQYPTRYAFEGRPGLEGSYARYRTYFHTWLSRLSWDDRHISDTWTKGAGYMLEVVTAGYAADDQYMSKWTGWYNTLPTWLTAMSVPMNGPRKGWLFSILVFSVTMFIIAYLLVTLYYWVKKRRS